MRWTMLRYLLGLASILGIAGNVAPCFAGYVQTLNSIAGANKISHWGLNETSGTNAADSWTTGTLDGSNAGTYTAVSLGASGPSATDGGFNGLGLTNNAIGFSGGSTQLLQMADAASFDGVQTLTMMMWFNFPTSISTSDDTQRYLGGLSDNTNLASGRYGFAFNTGSGTGANFGRVRGFIRLQDGGSELSEDSGTGGVQAPSAPSNYRDGMWHFLVMTMADSGLDKEYEIYVDGISRFTELIPGGAGKDLATRHTSALTGVLAFGRDLGDGSRLFNGRMDEISFIERRLSDSEVLTLYDSAVVPEPSAVLLLMCGAFGALAFSLKRFRKES